MFKIKHWGFVEVNQPQMFCSKLLQKFIDPEGVHGYSTSQEADIKAWLIEQDMWRCRVAQAPTPDKGAAGG